MARDRRGPSWRKFVFWASIGCILLSMPCVFFGVLGLLGIVADVSAAENRQYGWGFLRLALIPASVGVVGLVVTLMLRTPK